MRNRENRNLNRVQNSYGIDLTAQLNVKSNSIECQLLDFNALGARIKLKENLPDSTTEQIEDIRILYGQKVLCKIQNPDFVRREPDGVLIFSFKNKTGDQSVQRSPRIKLPFVIQGMLWGDDPVNLDQLLYFRVSNLSATGFRLTSSKSNCHLMPGMVFEKFSLQIPGYAITEVTFKIVNVSEDTDSLNFGCQIEGSPAAYAKAFKSIRIAHGDLIAQTDRPLAEIKDDIKNIKKFLGHIKVRTVRTDADYEEVLKVRFKAYKAANKTTMDQTVSDMGDLYDKHSIILIASVGKNAVGTLRIVMKEIGKDLPCEKSYDLKRIPQIKNDSVAEVSRFAIDPLFQGTDLFVAMSRKLVVELVVKDINYPLCLATKKLAPSYTGLGAIPITEPVPHPLLADETLTLYWLVPDRVFSSKAGSISWVFVIHPALKNLKKWGFRTKASNGLIHYLLFPLAVLRMAAKKKLAKFKKIGARSSHPAKAPAKDRA